MSKHVLAVNCNQVETRIHIFIINQSNIYKLYMKVNVLGNTDSLRNINA